MPVAPGPTRGQCSPHGALSVVGAMPETRTPQPLSLSLFLPTARCPSRSLTHASTPQKSEREGWHHTRHNTMDQHGLSEAPPAQTPEPAGEDQRPDRGSVGGPRIGGAQEVLEKGSLRAQGSKGVKRRVDKPRQAVTSAIKLLSLDIASSRVSLPELRS